MSRKAWAVSLLALLPLGLAACGGPPPVEAGSEKLHPLLTSTDEWTERYIKVKNNTYRCLFEHEGKAAEALDCDWGRPNPTTMPKNIVPVDVEASDEYSLLYLKVSTGQTIRCLVRENSGARDCDWSE